MVSSQSFSTFTVSDLFSRRGSRWSSWLGSHSTCWLRVTFYSGSLLISAPAWANSPIEPSPISELVGQERPGDRTMIADRAIFAESAFTSVNLPVAAVNSPSMPETFWQPEPEKPSKHVTQSKASSKAALIAPAHSRRAIDLMALPIAQTDSGSNSPSNTKAVQLRIATENPLSPYQGKNLDQGKSFEADSTSWLLTEAKQPDSTTPYPTTIAADPGTPTAPPIPLCSNPDPDLGCIRLQEPSPFPAAPAPILYLTPRLDFFRSNNILLGIDPIEDGLIRPSLALLAVPPLGPNTFIVASVEGSLNSYFKEPAFNYRELRVRAGIFQRLSSVMTAEIGWTNQQLFIASDRIPTFPAGTRFLNDHAIRFELSRRDQFTPRLFLSSFYQFRAGFAKPADRSRILNVLFLSLNYDLTPQVQLGLDYQFAAANFTVAPRTDIYHQVLGRITFNAFRNTQLSAYGGLSLGNSTERGIDFNSFIFGVTMSVNLVLF